jgi:glycine amidinotransferase/scyllo-inosamine-4-phosphate amidinotransferase 1
MKISTNNEYGELKSVIVGRCEQHAWPTDDLAFDEMIEASTYPNTLPRETLPNVVTQQAQEDLQHMADVLESRNITVYRPTITKPNWCYSSRDIMLSIGNRIIECPTMYTSRIDEADDHYADIKQEAIADGCDWIKAPAPQTEDDPTFDAANVLKFNNHLLYLVSSTGNLAGARWLQECVGSDFEVVTWEDIYAFAHIDSTIHSLDERTIALNSERVSEENIPAFLRDHRKVWVNEMAHSDFHVFPFASVWIGFNMLSISPETILADPIQIKLKEQLVAFGFEVLDIPMRQGRTLGGGQHCTTLDLHRE